MKKYLFLVLAILMPLFVACTPEQPCEGQFDQLQAYYEAASSEVMVTIPSYYGLKPEQVTFLAADGTDVSSSFLLQPEKTVSDSCRTQLSYRVETMSNRFSVTIVLQESWGEFLTAYGSVTLHVGS